jgi:hypothetical protein
MAAPCAPLWRMSFHWPWPVLQQSPEQHTVFDVVNPPSSPTMHAALQEALVRQTEDQPQAEQSRRDRSSQSHLIDGLPEPACLQCICILMVISRLNDLEVRVVEITHQQDSAATGISYCVQQVDLCTWPAGQVITRTAVVAFHPAYTACRAAAKDTEVRNGSNSFVSSLSWQASFHPIHTRQQSFQGTYGCTQTQATCHPCTHLQARTQMQSHSTSPCCP